MSEDKRVNTLVSFLPKRTLAANLGFPVEYLGISHSEETERYRIGILQQHAKADLYYQTLNVKTVEEEAVYNVKYLISVIAKPDQS